MVEKNDRRTPGSKERLAEISHHFLSEPAVVVDTRHRPSFMPVLLDDVADVWVAHCIARALTTRKRPSTVVYVEREMQQAALDTLANIDRRGLVVPLTRRGDWNDHNAAQLRLLKSMGTQNSQHKFCLIPISNLQTPVLDIFDRLLMPVAPGLAALRSAYLRIKRLSSNANPMIGVTIIACDNQEDARLYFDKLAVAALRFLRQRLIYCGYIPRHFAQGAGVEPVVRIAEGIPSELRDVTDHILTNKLYVSLTTSDTQP
ncbi:MAG: hypothetical protein FD165_1459 [Gammaproteobacteria bacterium]|nr:MAG: hypothetical protein FD165_1459 [Gammaproteobacteria bacterium]TND03954.1 MAG: hypothetical protein FD120_1663 [Gammaproteobacteria bacterium]